MGSGLCKDKSDLSIMASKATLGGSGQVSPPQSPTALRRSTTPPLAGVVGHTGSCSRSVSVLAQTPPRGVCTPLQAVRPTVHTPRRHGGSVDLSPCSSPSYSIRLAPPHSARSVPILHNRTTSVLVQPPLPARKSLRNTDVSTTYASTTDVQPSIWGTIESILADTPRVPSPEKGNPHGHLCDDGQHTESGRFGTKTPQFAPSPCKFPSQCDLPEGVSTFSTAPVVPDGKADKESNVVRALSARLPQPLVDLFSSRRMPERNTMPPNSKGTQQCDVLTTTDPQLPMLYFSD